MKIADLYIRVSTIEQAEKGYSQCNQYYHLKNYCEINNIEIRKVIFEIHSGKTFNRPEWEKFLIPIKKEPGTAGLLLFTKWDRFSRNKREAEQMIKVLRQFGVEPKTITQPLNSEIE